MANVRQLDFFIIARSSRGKTIALIITAGSAFEFAGVNRAHNNCSLRIHMGGDSAVAIRKDRGGSSACLLVNQQCLQRGGDAHNNVAMERKSLK